MLGASFLKGLGGGSGGASAGGEPDPGIGCTVRRVNGQHHGRRTLCGKQEHRVAWHA